MFNRQRGSKFGNIKQTYKGVLYDSKREILKAMELDSLLKAKKIKLWQRQDRIKLCGENGGSICTIVPDFTITHLDGSREVIEIKSKATMTPVWRLKWKLLQDKVKFDPTIKLTVEL